MSYFLPHLPSGWHVDEAIKSEEDRVVVIRFGHDWDSQCMTMDETLYAVAEKVQNYAVIYLTDITEVPDFNKACFFVIYYHALMDDCLDVRVVRPMHRHVLLSVCNSVLPINPLPESTDRRNKHIMIDLGTGNNNKMCVKSSPLPYLCLISSMFQ